MKKYFSEPEIEIRKYALVDGSVLTDSFPGDNDHNSLENDDPYDIFGQ